MCITHLLKTLRGPASQRIKCKPLDRSTQPWPLLPRQPLDSHFMVHGTKLFGPWHAARCCPSLCLLLECPLLPAFARLTHALLSAFSSNIALLDISDIISFLPQSSQKDSMQSFHFQQNLDYFFFLSSLSLKAEIILFYHCVSRT